MSDAMLTAVTAPAATAPAVEAPQAPATEAPAGNAPEVAIGKWVEQAKPEHRGYEFLKGKEKIDDLILYTKTREEELAKLSEELAKVPKKPGADAKPEEIAKWKAENGYAVKAEDYEFKRDGELKDLPVNQEVENFYRNVFLKNDIPKAVGEQIFKEMALMGKQMQIAQQAREKAEYESSLNNLKQAYKGEFDSNMKTIIEFGKQNFGDETWKLIDESGLGNNLQFANVLLSMGKEFGTGRFVKGASSGQAATSSAADILFPSLKKSS